MLDKVVISKDKKVATLVYTDKSAFNLTTDQNIIVFLDWFFTPTVMKLNNYEAAIASESEKTCPIILNVA